MDSPFKLLPNMSTLSPVYFKIEALEKYFSNPQYLIFFSDYRGSIVVSDDCLSNNEHEEYDYIRNFGLAYNKSNRYDRAVVLFYCDIIEMNLKCQFYWYSYLLPNQNDYYPNDGFVKNLILGEWGEDISIHDALVLEIEYINKMCDMMGLPHLFRHEYNAHSDYQNEKPGEYHVLLLPTKKCYYSFVSILEKMTVHNINESVFSIDKGFRKVDKIDENNQTKGSLQMFSEWLNKNCQAEKIDESIIKPLKSLRKERQIPAHEVITNAYDKALWRKQDELMKSVYTAIRTIRLLFANHSATKGLEIPSYLYDGKHIRIY